MTYLDASFANSPGVSHDSDIVSKGLSDLQAHQVTSASGDKVQQINIAISDVVTEAGAENWDREGAKAVTDETAYAAGRFVNRLPLTQLSLPEVSADYKGSIAFDWENGAGDHVVVVVHKDKLVYAALYANGEEMQGASPCGMFTDVPESVMEHINRVAKL